MNAYKPTDFAALIGIDWADRKHDVCLTLPDLKNFTLHWTAAGIR